MGNADETAVERLFGIGMSTSLKCAESGEGIQVRSTAV